MVCIITWPSPSWCSGAQVSGLTAKRLQLSTAWLCFWSLHWDRSSLVFMKCIFFFCVWQIDSKVSVFPFFPVPFVAEQPEPSNSSDKSIPWAHYVSDHYSEIKQIHLTVSSRISFNLVFFTFKFLTPLTLPYALWLWVPLISFVGFDT